MRTPKTTQIKTSETEISSEDTCSLSFTGIGSADSRPIYLLVENCFWHSLFVPEIEITIFFRNCSVADYGRSRIWQANEWPKKRVRRPDYEASSQYSGFTVRTQSEHVSISSHLDQYVGDATASWSIAQEKRFDGECNTCTWWVHAGGYQWIETISRGKRTLGRSTASKKTNNEREQSRTGAGKASLSLWYAWEGYSVGHTSARHTSFVHFNLHSALLGSIR